MVSRYRIATFISTVCRKVFASAMVVVLIFSPLAASWHVKQAYAASLTSMSVGLSNNLNSATGVTWTIGFTTATTATISTVEMTFQSGVNVASAALGSVTGLGASTIGVSGQTVTLTVTSPASVSSSTAISIPLTGITNPSTIGNYYVSVTTKASSSSVDDGATLAYLDADGSASGITDNQVTVTANVAPTIELTIYGDSGHSATTNACNLGTVTSAGVSTCSYYLRVGTNDADGLTVRVVADNQLNNSGDTADIDDVSDNTVTAGAEEHGIRVVVGTGLTADAAFTPNTEDNAVPTSIGNLATSTGPITAGTGTDIEITHRASVSTSTPADTYDQIVTYTAYTN